MKGQGEGAGRRGRVKGQGEGAGRSVREGKEEADLFPHNPIIIIYPCVLPPVSFSLSSLPVSASWIIGMNVFFFPGTCRWIKVLRR